MWWYVHKYGRKYGFGYIQIIDRLVIPVCFAGMMIRLGNLMNSEIYGTYTDLPWGFIFVRDPWGDGLPHHPTQIYEALSYCILPYPPVAVPHQTRQAAHRHHLRHFPHRPLRHEVSYRIHQAGSVRLRGRHGSDFEAGMVLNMGQWLSLPFILTGILLLIWSARKGGPARIQNNTIRHGANQQH